MQVVCRDWIGPDAGETCQIWQHQHRRSSRTNAVRVPYHNDHSGRVGLGSCEYDSDPFVLRNRYRARYFIFGILCFAVTSL